MVPTRNVEIALLRRWDPCTHRAPWLPIVSARRFHRANVYPPRPFPRRREVDRHHTPALALVALPQGSTPTGWRPASHARNRACSAVGGRINEQRCVESRCDYGVLRTKKEMFALQISKKRGSPRGSRRSLTEMINVLHGNGLLAGLLC